MHGILTNVTRSRGTILLTVLLAGGISLYGMAHADEGGSRVHIPTCDEVGQCRKGGEKKLLLDDHAAWSGIIQMYAAHVGCKLDRKGDHHVRLRCPDKVSIPSATPERVFSVEDLNANALIGANTVQSRGITGDGVRVAVLDTGVDGTHPELQGVIAATADFTGDGPDDVIGHGTHVSGILAGQGVRDVSGAAGTDRALGVSPAARLLVGKVCRNAGYCLEGDIIAGIEWAVSEQAKVINMSLGGGSFAGNCDADTLAAEANWAVSQGVTVVASAGNGGAGGEGLATPACGSRVISVGAVDAQGGHPSWSSFGQALDVTAPGVNILSSISCLAGNSCPDASYGWWNGTSMAAPQVSGIAALLLQADPTLTPDAVRTAITSTATDLGPAGFDTQFGFGMADADAAVRLVRPEDPSASSSSAISSGQGSSETSSDSPSSAPAESSSAAFSSEHASRSASSRGDEHRDPDSDGFHSAAPGAEHGPGHDGERSSSSSSSAASHEKPRCAAMDWVCQEFGQCVNGKQQRLCNVINADCAPSDDMRPPRERQCVSVPPRTDGPKNGPTPPNGQAPHGNGPGEGPHDGGRR
jgi:hypothetical protein